MRTCTRTHTKANCSQTVVSVLRNEGHWWMALLRSDCSHLLSGWLSGDKLGVRSSPPFEPTVSQFRTTHFKPIIGLGEEKKANTLPLVGTVWWAPSLKMAGWKREAINVKVNWAATLSYRDQSHLSAFPSLALGAYAPSYPSPLECWNIPGTSTIACL